MSRLPGADATVERPDPGRSLLGDSLTWRVVLIAMLPAWVVGGSGWLGSDLNRITIAMLLSVAGPVFAYFLPGFAPSLGGRPEKRRAVARQAVRLALLLGVATFLVLLFGGIPAACDGGYECPV
jgi:hypothetical protein